MWKMIKRWKEVWGVDGVDGWYVSGVDEGVLWVTRIVV